MSIYLNSDCAQNGDRVDNHVLDWPFLHIGDHVPVQIHRWRAARSEDALQLALDYGKPLLITESVHKR